MLYSIFWCEREREKLMVTCIEDEGRKGQHESQLLRYSCGLFYAVKFSLKIQYTNRNMNICSVKWPKWKYREKPNHNKKENTRAKKRESKAKEPKTTIAENAWLLLNCRFSVYQQLLRLRIIDGQQRFGRMERK